MGDGMLCCAGSKPSESLSWFDMFGGKYRKGVMMGIILFAIQQFAGINALVYFSTSVFRQVDGQHAECQQPTSQWIYDPEF